MDIKEALGQLDTMNDEQWTSEGLPKVDVISEMVGSTVTRQQITDAGPKFTRSNTELDEVEGEGEIEKPSVDEEVDNSLIEEFATERPVPVDEFLIFLRTVPSKQLVALSEVLEKQQADMTEARKQVEEYDSRIRQALAFTRSRIKREVPDLSETAANQAYLESQAAQRAEKKARTEAILRGIDVKSLDPRAPIDRAMARKTQRGTQRPGT